MSESRTRYFLGLILLYVTVTVGFGIVSLKGGHTQTDAVLTNKLVVERFAEGRLFFRNFLKIGNFYKHVVSFFALPLVLTDYFPFVYLESLPLGKRLLILWSARLVSLLSALGSIVVVYLLGRELYDNRTIGLLGAFFLAANKDFLNQSVLATEDLLSFFLLLICLFFALLYSKNRSSRFYVLGWVTAGLAIGTKPTTGIAMVPLLLIEFNRYWGNEASPSELIVWSVRGLLLSLGGFLLTTPSLFVYPARFLQQFFEQFQTRYNPGAVPSAHPYFIHLMNLVRAGGYPLFFCLLAGVTSRCYRGLTDGFSEFETELLILAGLYVLFVGSWNNTAAHYMLMLVPILSLFAGHWLYRLLTDVPNAIKILVVVGLIGFSVGYTTVSFARIAHTSQDESREWINRSVPVEATVETWGIKQYYPDLRNDLTTINQDFIAPDDEGWNRTRHRLENGKPDILLLSEPFYRRHLIGQPTEISRTLRRLLQDRHPRYGIYRTFGPSPRLEHSYGARLRRSFHSRPLFPIDRNLTLLVRNP